MDVLSTVCPVLVRTVPSMYRACQVLSAWYCGQTMYTIKEASARSGLPIATIRAWERRYRAVEPARTPSGYRLYDDAAVDRLIAMRQLVEVEGVRPGQAAGQVRDDDARVRELVDRARSDVDARPPTSESGDLAATDGIRRRLPRRRPAVGPRRARVIVGRGPREPALRAGGRGRRLPCPPRGRRRLGQTARSTWPRSMPRARRVRRRFAERSTPRARPDGSVDVLVGLPPGPAT